MHNKRRVGQRYQPTLSSSKNQLGRELLELPSGLVFRDDCEQFKTGSPGWEDQTIFPVSPTSLPRNLDLPTRNPKVQFLFRLTLSRQSTSFCSITLLLILVQLYLRGVIRKRGSEGLKNFTLLNSFYIWRIFFDLSQICPVF